MKTARASSSSPTSPADTVSGAGRRQGGPQQQEIAERARALWNEYGCPSGRDEEIWLEAERQLIGTGYATSSAQGRREVESAVSYGSGSGSSTGSATRSSRRRAA